MQAGADAARAVFVDPSGRRHRLVVRTAWALSALGVAYVGLVVLSLLLPPSMSRLTVPGLGPVLPGPAAAPLGAAEGEADGPEVLLVRTPSPSPSRPAATPARRATPSAGRSPAAASAAPSAPASPTPAASPSRATGRPSTSPSEPNGAAPSAPPGQADRSPKPRPTPSKRPR